MSTGLKPVWAGRNMRLDPFRLPQVVSYATCDDFGDVTFTIGDADLVSVADGERQSVTLERSVGLEDHIGGRIIRVAMHRVGADRGTSRREPQIENLHPGNPQVRHDGFPCRQRSSATASTMIAPVTICCTQFG